MALKSISYLARAFILLSCILAVFHGANAATGAPSVKNADAAKLLARLTELSEIVANAKMTDIDLYAGWPVRSGQMLDSASKIKGKILSIVEEFPERDPWNLNYLVVAEPEGNGGGWTAIKFEAPLWQEPLVISAYPAGPDRIRDKSVHFYNGKLDGNRATLVFYAERDFTGIDHRSFSTGVPTQIAFSLFELRSTEDVQKYPGDEISGAVSQDIPGAFVRVAWFTSTRKYCNTDYAMFRELGLRMPQDSAAEADIKEVCNGAP